MNTEKTHQRFWEAMRARFGKRWLDDFGNEPSAPWIQLLNKHTPNHLRDALELMGEQKLQHPPTLPQFESLLKHASSKAPHQDTDLPRKYWRSVIHGTCMRHAALLNLVPWGETRLERMPTNEIYELAERQCRELLDWACDSERTAGQRTPGIEQHVNQTLWNLLKPWARQKGEFDTSHLSANVPRDTKREATQ
jgi:hypothetical protein